MDDAEVTLLSLSLCLCRVAALPSVLATICHHVAHPCQLSASQSPACRSPALANTRLVTSRRRARSPRCPGPSGRDRQWRQSHPKYAMPRRAEYILRCAGYKSGPDCGPPVCGNYGLPAHACFRMGWAGMPMFLLPRIGGSPASGALPLVHIGRFTTRTRGRTTTR